MFSHTRQAVAPSGTVRYCVYGEMSPSRVHSAFLAARAQVGSRVRVRHMTGAVKSSRAQRLAVRERSTTEGNLFCSPTSGPLERMSQQPGGAWVRVRVYLSALITSLETL